MNIFEMSRTFLIFQPLDSNNLYNSENFTIADLLLEQCKGNDYVPNNKIYSVKNE